jgi:hypothetical protein
MASTLPNYDQRVRAAVASYWSVRLTQAEKSRDLGVVNIGLRAEVTGGRHVDVWKAVERGIIDSPLRPWLGYFMLIEDNDAWNRRSAPRRPVWSADPVFDGASAAERATIFFDRMVRERLLDAACVVLARKSDGHVRFPDEMLSFQAFAAAMFGRCLQFKVTNPDLPWGD